MNGRGRRFAAPDASQADNWTPESAWDGAAEQSAIAAVEAQSHRNLVMSRSVPAVPRFRLRRVSVTEKAEPVLFVMLD